MSNRALIVVDMQRDFCKGGSLAVTDAEYAIPYINNLIDMFMNQNDLVIYTRDWHPPETPHFDTWPAHCVADTEGAMFHPGIIHPDNYYPLGLVDKGLGLDDGYSAFSTPASVKLFKENSVEYFPDLDELLAGEGIEYLTVCGLALDYCVGTTIKNAHALGYKVLLPLHATAGVSGITTVQMMSELSKICFFAS